MAKGGARVRSGPPADPNSGASDRKRRQAATAAKKAAAAQAAAGTAKDLPITSPDFNPMALPARGRTGRVPAFPLPSTGERRAREMELWRELWRTPQAVAWEREPYRWPTIAKYCRVMAATESDPAASAALLSRERELRIECGLSPDGLKANGWAIAPDELAAKRAQKTPAKKVAPKAAPVRRLR